MKRIISVFLIILTVIGTALVVPTAFAENTGEYKGFQYVVNEDSTVSITGYIGDKARVSIPVRINNMEVVSILENAFVNADKAKEYYIPVSVKSIAPKSVGYKENGKKRLGLTIIGHINTKAETYAKENKIRFNALADKMTINAKLITLGKNEKHLLKATLEPKNAKSKVTFISNNDYIAKVDNSGNITAKNVGKTKIVVKTDNGKKRSCTVVVKKAPTSLKLSRKKMIMGRTEKLPLKAIIDAGTYASDYNWKSSKKGIVQIIRTSQKGVTIRAAGIGVTTVSATLYNGKTYKCKVIVKKQPSRIKISRKELWLERNKSFDLDYEIPKGSVSNTIEFSSSNPKIVSVNKKTGVINSHKKLGTAYIKVKTFNGKWSRTKVVVKKQVGFNAYTGTTVSKVLAIKPSIYLAWMKSHEKDKYYVDTKYKPFDCRNPNGDCSGKNGANNDYGKPGLNCTGFVWHALTIPCRKSGGNTAMIPTLGGWVALFENYGVTRKQFYSVKEMLMSGFLEQGDIMFIADNCNEHMLSNHHHVGIYWGNGESDVFWHSLGSKNRISRIFTISDKPKYIALKFK